MSHKLLVQTASERLQMASELIPTAAGGSCRRVRTKGLLVEEGTNKKCRSALGEKAKDQTRTELRIKDRSGSQSRKCKSREDVAVGGQ